MKHPRQLIRDAAMLMLINQGPWLDHVYKNRNRALSQRPAQRSSRSQLPALVIYTREEKAIIFNAAPREYERTVELVLEFVTDAVDEVDDLLDDAALLIERIIGRDDTLGGTANDCVYVASNIVIIEQGVERPIGAIALTFEVSYFSTWPDGPEDGAPDGGYNATLPGMHSLRIDYSLDNQQNDQRDRAQTHIEGLDQ